MSRTAKIIAHPHAQLGLSGEQVAQRNAAGLTNRFSQASSRSLWEIVRANVLTLFNAIVAGSFILLLVLGQWRDALFGFSAVGNAVIGVVQEYRAKRALDRLAVINTPHARVLRDGTVQDIEVEAVVHEDILVLRVGDQIPADATTIDSESLEIDESLLTGEADPVLKAPVDDVLSGSSVVAGHGLARVTRVGAESFASRLTAEAKRFSLVNSEIRNGLNRVLRWIIWALLPIMLIVVNGQMQAAGGWELAISSGSWRTAVVGAVASIIAMVPLGLVLMTSVAFAVSGVRLARHKVLIQELAAVEVLARVDIICLDKTGTLTEGAIVFDAVHSLATTPETGADEWPGWRESLGWFGADPNANATARCLAEEFTADSALGAVAAIPFSSERKWSAVAFGADTVAAGTWVLGAPELVLNPESPRGSAAATVLDEANTLASAGMRTLVLAHSSEMISTNAAGAAGTAAGAGLPSRLSSTVLLTFREKVRPDAARTLAYFRDQGVGVRIISGDDPQTVAAVAREVGIHVEEGYDARTLPADPDQLADMMEQQLVFGRVTPTQKKDMVRALQRRGHVVAMTGDGVNDALALKHADIGIAMNTAAAATKAVSRLVLLDGRFDRLPSVVAEGRRVIANIERVSVLYLSKTAYAIAMSMIFGALIWGFPFLPRQLSATDGLTIGIPSFFLALMANTRRYRPGFLKRSLWFAVPAGLIVTAGILAVNAYARLVGGFSTEDVHGASVITLSLIALWVLVVVSRPLNLARVGIVLAMYIVLVGMLTIPLPRDFFNLAVPPPALLQLSVITAFVGCLAVEILGRIRARVNARFRGRPV
ncbi:HAD family hydrolase [Cryobacterium sp. TMT1-3]|uniref:HAD-IC family P-type ATPase n=1 Tax=Cryobacterium sp. TMT1-3 TaxID=1259237 RepID=UPI00106B73E5|nr:HAD-IC family P-type ATPase [Cryobacterium sp. TMT1-3]TFC25579.1 HAD family hydrolase [Cryobacterium sp. TMT1-3]